MLKISYGVQKKVSHSIYGITRYYNIHVYRCVHTFLIPVDLS